MAKRLDEVDLSVRTSNCLSTLNIKYLGELIQYTPAKLMEIHAFGKKSLQELHALFAATNLPLGLQITEWTPDLTGAVPIAAAGLPTKVEPGENGLTPDQKLFLAQPIQRFHLSKRVAGLLRAREIIHIGDLAVLSVDQARTLLELDEIALRELAGLLAFEELYFGVAISNWSAETAAEWEQAYHIERSELCKRHALLDANVDPPPLEVELEKLVRTILKSTSERNVNVVVRFFGFDGTGKKTLEEVGQRFGVTRERVRQITSKFTKRVHGRRLYLPIFRLTCNHLVGSLPNTPRALGQSLHGQRITRCDFDMSGIVAMLRLLDEEDLFDIVAIGEEVLAVRRNEADYFKRVLRIAGAIVSAFGCGHIEHIVSDLETGHEQAVDALGVTDVLDRNPDLRWLNQGREWFTIVETKRNRLSNIVRKVLSVTPTISLAELRGAIKRVHRLDGFAPPSDILRAFCSSLSFCDVVDEHVISNQPISPAETLGEIERCFVDVLREHGPAMSSNAFRDECLKRGMNANSFYQYITYSPIICRLIREVYALVGADVPPGSIEDIPQSFAKAPVLIGHDWTDDGRIRISYRLNTSNVRNGVFTLPSALKGLLSGEFFIQSSGTGSRTIISAEGGRLTGLHRPIAIRGGQPDDVIIVAFDPRRGSAELRFGEEDSKLSNETGTDAASPISFGTTPSDLSRLTPPITADDLMGVGKEWQSISTAPVEEELEVRLEDPFGRYVLLFPCKLVPGRGWINSRLETPLRAEPVDWRYWDEASIHF